MLAIRDAVPGWTSTEELIALVCELLDTGNRAFVAAHSKRGTPQPKPLQIIRPTRRRPDPSKPRQATKAEMAAFFGGAVVVQAVAPAERPCARCGAVPGEDCRTRLGAPARRPHAARSAPAQVTAATDGPSPTVMP